MLCSSTKKSDRISEIKKIEKRRSRYRKEEEKWARSRKATKEKEAVACCVANAFCFLEKEGFCWNITMRSKPTLRAAVRSVNARGKANCSEQNFSNLSASGEISRLLQSPTPEESELFTSLRRSLKLPFRRTRCPQERG